MQFIPVPASQYSANMRITLDRRYQDYLLGLLLDKNLSGSQPGSDVRDVARARTLTALRRVGNNRKGDVLRFLRESGLIYKGKEIVDLREADLSDADLSNIKLRGGFKK